MDVNMDAIIEIAKTLSLKQMSVPLCEEEALLKEYAIRATTEYCKWTEGLFVEMRERLKDDRHNTP